MLSPGLADSCSSSERNRLPKRSSLKSQLANSRSTHDRCDFPSAIACRWRFRTLLFVTEHRVTAVHGSSISHLLQVTAIIICNLPSLQGKLWVIERLTN